jgi:hypothetical protein
LAWPDRRWEDHSYGLRIGFLYDVQGESLCAVYLTRSLGTKLPLELFGDGAVIILFAQPLFDHLPRHIMMPTPKGATKSNHHLRTALDTQNCEAHVILMNKLLVYHHNSQSAFAITHREVHPLEF